MRILFEFTKGARLRFVSHLDMQRLMQRALRRSGLPIKYSGGYSPHAVMSFASALGIGVWSKCEVLDVKMKQECSLKEAFDAINGALPADMHINRVAAVEDTHAAAMAMVTWSDYEITFAPAQAEIAQIAVKLLEMGEIMAMRKTKSGEKECDVRPMIASVSAENLPDGGAKVSARLMLSSEGTLKPDLFIKIAAEKCGCAYETGDADVVRCALLTGKDALSAREIMTDGVKEIYPERV